MKVSRTTLTNPIQADEKSLADAEENSFERPAKFLLDFRLRQKLKLLREKVANAMTILHSTIGTIKCLLRHHMSRMKSFGSASGSTSADVITSIFKEQLHLAYTDLTKFESLKEKIRDTASLLSDLLSYDHAFSLEQLVQEQKDDSRVMRELSEKATEDSRSIKLITIITAVFFPATVTGVIIHGSDSNIGLLTYAEFLFHTIRPDWQWQFSNGTLYLGVFRSHNTLDCTYHSSMGCVTQRFYVDI